MMSKLKKGLDVELRKLPFRARLAVRWGTPLTWLRILLTISREIGAETSKRYRKSKSKRHRFTRDALIRLHARSCQITTEIIVLLENGFADGAMAIYYKLGDLDGATAVAGASNAGLTEPGQNAAISLTAISACLFGSRPKVEDVIALQTMALVREKAVAEFVRAGRRLKRDHNTNKSGHRKN